MKKLFIYHTETGNGDVVGNYYKEKKYAVEKIKAKLLPKAFVLQILTGGYKARAGIKDPIGELTNDITKYDEIVIGSPVWNDRLCSPVRGLLSKYDLKDKKLKFVLYSGSGKANHAEKFISKEYPSAKVIILKQPKDNKDELSKLED